jgi:PhnB protein
MAVNPIPTDYPRIIPSLACKGASDALEFYTAVLGATLRYKMDGPGGIVAHAELTLGDSMIMVADEFPDMGFLSPASVGGTPVSLMVYVEDVDAVVADAIARGATELSPVSDEFYGDRVGRFEDPWGHRWSIATHVEDVSEDEMARRAEAMMAGG